MNTVTIGFLALLAASFLLREWLAWRQIRHVRAGREQVPDAFRDRVPLAAHQRAADYTVARTRTAMLELGWETVLLLAWTLGGGLALLDQAWQAAGWSTLWTGVAVILSAQLVSALLELPFSIYETFFVEQRFGFNRTTPATFIADMVKQGLLMLAFGVPLVAVILWLMEVAGPLWWLWAWLVWMGFTLLMTWAYPTFIAPLFNRFTPLTDAGLRERIERLLKRCGFRASGIFVMDGSKRSGHGNAYFTGLGRNKRIVFFDTLLETLEPDEIEAVLAHELGHFRRKHVQKRMFVMALMSLGGLALLGWLIQQPAFFTGLGVPEPSTYMGLLLFMFVTPVIGTFIQPLAAAFSRRHEFEADEFAAQETDADHLVRALVKLYRENASTLTPDPLYSAFHDSHPPAPVRVGHLSSRMQTAGAH